MKKMSGISALVACASLFFVAAAFASVSPERIRVEGIRLSPSVLTLEIGKTRVLSFDVLPENATNKNVSWSTTNHRIAPVNDAVVGGISVGTATITAKTADGGFETSCDVTVKDIEIPTPGCNVSSARGVSIGLAALFIVPTMLLSAATGGCISG